MVVCGSVAMKHVTSPNGRRLSQRAPSDPSTNELSY